VQAALRELGLPDGVRVLDDYTRTAPEAAATVGCELGAIVKSLVFRGAVSGEAVLVLVSGDNRADEALVEAAIGEAVERADADFVRAATGYAIGGVAPIGHPAPLRTVVDRDLLRFDVVWAAAGTPRAVFPVAPDALAAALGVAAVDVAVRG
jgi:prolyl-tRNA editing enzyme YbaK/EbsC (Cys-tRNA(Pro) deacylase)